MKQVTTAPEREKASHIRRHVLDRIESGALRPGQKWPGARKLAEETGVSFQSVQNAISSLRQDGVIVTSPRSGTYVAKDVSGIVLNYSLRSGHSHYPLFEELRSTLERRVPWLRVFGHSFRCLFELRITIDAQRAQNEYLDLSDVFAEAFPDASVFFDWPFNAFRNGDRLFAVPYIFSPRAIFYNPTVLKAAGCPAPMPGWTIDDFLKLVARLRKSLPSERVINFEPGTNMWMNFVFRAGGRLISKDADNPVWIDHPTTRRGLAIFAAIKKALKDPPLHTNYLEHLDTFASGDMALLLGQRQATTRFRQKAFDDWETVTLPVIEGGVDVSAQTTEAVCVRKSCPDPALAVEILRAMLSEEVQNIFGTSGYGIPILKRAAITNIDLASPRDALFLSEAGKVTAEYNLDSPELEELVRLGISQIWEDDLDIDATTAELASAVRTFLKIKRRKKSNGN